MRNFDGRDLLADELVQLVGHWRTARWWEKWAIAHTIACKVAFRLDTLTQALRGGEGK